MSNTSMNIRMDSDVKKQAQELFAQFGLDNYRQHGKRRISGGD